jgi:hypothetical protein
MGNKNPTKWVLKGSVEKLKILIVNQNGNEFVFESNHKAINNYKVKIILKCKWKGIVNIIYK